MHKAATNSYLNLVAFLNFNIDSFLSELIDSFRLSQKENLDSIALRVLVDIVGKVTIDFIHLVPDADMLAAFHQLFYIDHKLVDFILSFLVLYVPLIIICFYLLMSFFQFLVGFLQLLVGV